MEVKREQGGLPSEAQGGDGLKFNCFYQIKHDLLPPNAPDKLKATQVVMITFKNLTYNTVVVNYADADAVCAFISTPTVFVDPGLYREPYPELEGCFVIDNKFAQKLLFRQVSEEEYNERKCSMDFWLVGGMTSQERNDRVWTVLEDAKLVESLVNMVKNGVYKADNGFKSGYLQHLEQALKESLPNSGILSEPHVESRIETMKKDWQVIYDMVHGSNTSGFSFDSKKNCVIAEAPVWEAYLQVNKEAAKWKNETFPHFEDLCIVFGKDKANGSRVRDVIEMDVKLEDRSNEVEENHSDNQDDASHAHINIQSQECTSGSKKRKNRSESLHEVIKDATFGDKVMKALASVVEVEVEMFKKTSMIANELEKFGTFSENEMFCALEKITKHSASVIIFWSLKEERRENWVRFMLNH